MAEPKRINLALQGGGAHGAFTWGVLDRLMEEPDIAIEAISGTSAGAINGAMLVSGFETGGPDGARAAMERFWRRVAELSDLSPVSGAAITDWFRTPWMLDNAFAYKAFEMVSGMFSPYQFNPMNVNPLKMALMDTLDAGFLKTCARIRLFACATNVRTGKIRIFEGEELSIDALLASACLPQVFQTVVIDGEPYWDGGFVGNPPLFPLIYNAASRDIMLVQINPIVRDEIPVTASAIENRVNEISFNSSLMREMRAIAFVKRLIAENRLDTGRYKDLLIHLVHAEDHMRGLGVASKFAVNWDFLTDMRDVGWAACEVWLKTHKADLGQRTTVDLEGYFL